MTMVYFRRGNSFYAFTVHAEAKTLWIATVNNKRLKALVLIYLLYDIILSDNLLLLKDCVD